MRKKLFVHILLFLFYLNAAHAQQIVSLVEKEILSKRSQAVTSVNFFDSHTKEYDPLQHPEQKIQKGTLVKINSAALHELRENEHKGILTLNVPTPEGNLTLEQLERKAEVNVTNVKDGRKWEERIILGKTYSGIIKGYPNSWVIINDYVKDINFTYCIPGLGMYSLTKMSKDNEEQFVLHKMANNNTETHPLPVNEPNAQKETRELDPEIFTDSLKFAKALAKTKNESKQFISTEQNIAQPAFAVRPIKIKFFVHYDLTRYFLSNPSTLATKLGWIYGWTQGIYNQIGVATDPVLDLLIEWSPTSYLSSHIPSPSENAIQTRLEYAHTYLPLYSSDIKDISFVLFAGRPNPILNFDNSNSISYGAGTFCNANESICVADLAITGADMTWDDIYANVCHIAYQSARIIGCPNTYDCRWVKQNCWEPICSNIGSLEYYIYPPTCPRLLGLAYNYNDNPTIMSKRESFSDMAVNNGFGPDPGAVIRNIVSHSCCLAVASTTDAPSPLPSETCNGWCGPLIIPIVFINSPTSVVLGWTDNFNTHRYLVQYKPSNSTAWQDVYTTTASLPLNNLTAFTTYNVRIFNSDGFILYDPTAFSFTAGYSPGGGGDVTTCLRTRGVMLNNITHNSVGVSWVPVSDANTKQYYVKIEIPGVRVVDEYFTTGTSYTFYGLTPGTNYTVKVVTMCHTGNKSSYTAAYFTTLAACAPATNLTALNIRPESIVLNWIPNPAAQTHRLWYRTLGSYSWALYAYPVTPPFTLTGLYEGTSYEVKIVSDCGNFNESPDPLILNVTTTWWTFRPGSITKNDKNTPVKNKGSVSDNTVIKNTITVSPNPAHGNSIFITIPDVLSKPGVLNIINTDGKMIKAIAWPMGSKKIEVPIGELSGGMYQVRLAGDHDIQTTNFVKQ